MKGHSTPVVMRASIVAVARAVGLAFGGITVDDIRGRTRVRSIALARMVTVYIARSELGLSYPEVGRELGLDHTTAMSAVKRVVRMLQEQDVRVVAAVEAGEKAAERWNHSGVSTGLEALRERRREIGQQLRELVAEAHKIDAILGVLPAPTELDAEVVRPKLIGVAG